jgi:hypothetical protein
MKRFSLAVLLLLAPLRAIAQEPAPSPSQAPAPAPSPSPAVTTPAPPAADASTAGAPSTASASTPTFSTEVELVTVDVVVTDKKNASVTDLKRDDFTILEDGKPQEISTFDSIQVPDAPAAVPATKPPISLNTSNDERTARTFVILFDDVHLTMFQALTAKKAIAQFLQTGVREGDRVSIVAAAAAPGGARAWRRAART